MACSLSTAYCGVEAGHIQPGETVAIVGLGAVGLCMVLAASAEGAKEIIGIDTVQRRRDKAVELGATSVGSPLDSEWMESKNGAADVVLVATANPKAMETAPFLARKAGRIIVIGSQLSATLPFERMAGYALHLHATWSKIGGAYMEKVVGLVTDGRMDAAALENLVTHVIPLGEIERAFQLFSDYEAGATKIGIEA
jgi:threonine dehydrogenase-like Zn-dependent dehydrogenase